MLNKKHNFESSLKLLFKLYKYIGLIQFQQNDNNKITIWNKIYSILIIIIFIILNCYIPDFLNNIGYYEYHGDIILSIAVHIHVYIFLSAYICNVLIFILKNHQLLNIYNELIKIHINRIKIRYNIVYLFILLELIIGFLLIIILYILDVVIYSEISLISLTCGFIMGMNGFYMYLIDILFLNLILLIWFSLKQLNLDILNNIKCLTTFVQQSNIIRSQYYRICELSQIVINFFCIHLFLSFIHGYVQIGFYLYNLFYNVIVIDTDTDNDLIIVLLLLFYYVLKFSCIFYVCELVEFEVSIIHHLLYTVFCY